MKDIPWQGWASGAFALALVIGTVSLWIWSKRKNTPRYRRDRVIDTLTWLRDQKIEARLYHKR